MRNTSFLAGLIALLFALPAYAQLALDLSAKGHMVVGPSTTPCAAGVAGGIRWNSPTLQYCDGTNWLTITNSASGGAVWSGLTAPTANLALAMAGYTSTFTYGAATSTANLFNLTDTASNTGTGYLLNLTTATGSALKPFHVSAAGTEAIAVLANGNIGIGTVSPGARLDINGREYLGSSTIAGGITFRRYGDGSPQGSIGYATGTETGEIRLIANGGGGIFTIYTGGGEHARFDNAGRLGLGTVSPLGGLDVQAPLTAASGVAYGTRLQQALTAAANNDTLYGLYINPTYTPGAFTGVTDYDLAFGGSAARTIAVLGNGTSAGSSLTVQAGSTAGGTNKAGGDLTLSAGQSTGAAGSNIIFKTALAGTAGTTSNAPVEAMRIDNNGRIGIGSTSAIYRMFVTNNGGNGVIGLKNFAADRYADVNFEDNNGVLQGSLGWANSSAPFFPNLIYYGSNNANDVIIYSNATERLRVTAAGLVGVGTNSPATRLDVNGTLRVANGGETCGSIYAGGIRWNSPNLQYCNGTSWTTLGSSAPAGSSGQVQFNSSGSFGASSNLFWDSANARLGIGTATPGTKLDIAGLGLLMSIGTSSGGQSEYMQVNGGRSFFGYDPVLNAAVVQGGNCCSGAGADSKGIEFNVNNAVFGSGTAMFIAPSGKIGIGTTSPGDALQVLGKISGGSYPSIHYNTLDLSGNNGGNSDMRFAMGVESGNPVTLLVGKQNVVGTGDVFFQALPLSTGYGILETWNGAGTILGTGNGTPILFRPNRTEAMRIMSGGNVGIGTSSPGNTLDINGTFRVRNSNTGTYNYLVMNAGNATTSLPANINVNRLRFGGNDTGSNYFTVQGTGDADYLTINGGNVGIGTTSPQASLHVSDASAARLIVADTNDGTSPEISMYEKYGAAPGQLGFGIRYDGGNANNLNQLVFGAYDLSTTFTPYMAINRNGGNVGIGTTAPKSLLDVNGGVAIGTYAGTTAAPSNSLIVSNTVGIGTATQINSGMLSISYSGANNSPIEFTNTETNGQTWAIGDNAGFNCKAGDFCIYDEDAGTADVAIASSGNVGLGTTSPKATLDVNGYMRLAKNSAQPVACSAGNDGAIALSHVYTICVCKGGSSSWVQSKDGTTACSW